MMPDKMAMLTAALEGMLLGDETISARAVVRRCAGVLNHASDVTRNPERRRLLEEYSFRQAAIRTSTARSTKNSRVSLERQIAVQRDEIAELKRQRDFLIASHRATILACAERGGYRAWRNFFDGYESGLAELKALDALPSEVSLSNLTPIG